VIDIRNPAAPAEIGFIPAKAPYYHGEGAHVISVKTPQFTGDLLAVNDETYGSNIPSDCAPEDLSGGGFDLYDVTDPFHPRTLIQAAGDDDDDPETEPRADGSGNSYHSVFIWQDGPRAYLVASDNQELTDVDIFDITDPQNPEEVADLDLVELFPEILDGEEGNGGAFFHHDVVVKKIGNRQVMLADYWDAGYVQLDVTDPAHPTRITDTTFAGEDPLLPGSGLSPEGNGHQGEFSFDNQFILAADEDFAPFRSVVRALSGSTAGRVQASTEGDSNATIDGLPDGKLNGPSLFISDGGCDPDTFEAAPADDADPNTDDIALVERGVCFFADKFANAEAKGWDGVVIYNQERPDDGNVSMLTGPANIPGVHMRRVNALGPEGVLSDSATTPPGGTAGPDLEILNQFDGWGYAHLYDAQTSELLDSYAIPEAMDPRYARGFGDLSIHEFAADPTEPVAYSAYYGGGLRAFTFSRAGGLQESGKYIDPGGSNFWGVEQFTGADGERYVAGSDRDFGLVILRYTGAGAPKRPTCSDSAAGTTPGAPVGVKLVCTDANGNGLRVRTTSAPGHGTISAVGGDGSVVYTPAAGFSGSDSFTFVANDGAADSAPATATVNVSAPPATAPGKVLPSSLLTVQLGAFGNGQMRLTVSSRAPGRLVVRLRGLGTTLYRQVHTFTGAQTKVITLKLSRSKLATLRRATGPGRTRRGDLRLGYTATGGPYNPVDLVVTLRR
jgi:hypothetical protein